MLFTAPIWLLALAPWAAVAAYLLLGRRPRADVPFLELWRVDAPDVTVRRRLSTPPLGLVLALLAVLLAIVAAAGPGTRAAGGARLAVVVDAGASMSARGRQAERFREVAADLSLDLRRQGLDDVAIDVVVVPGGGSSRTTAVDLPAAVAAVPPTALDTSADVARVVRERLAAGDAGVVALTDRPLGVVDDRLAQATPTAAASDVGIAAFAVRRTPVPQAMVRVGRTGADSSFAQVLVRVTTSGSSIDRTVAVPAAGQTVDVFVPLAAVGAVATAELLNPAGGPLADDFPADDRLDVASVAYWPTVEPAAAVGDLRRLVDLYARARPPGERSVRVRLVTAAGQLAENDAGVVLSAVTSPASPTRATVVADHPVTRAAGDWSAVPLSAVGDRTLPEGGGWTTILSDAAGPLVAVREQAVVLSAGRAARQVWTALATGGWSNRPEFVLFWSAAFDWAGHAEGGGERMSASPLAELSGEWTPVALAPGPDGRQWWPGVYERAGDGARQAFGPAALPEGGVVRKDWSPAVARAATAGWRVVSWSPWLTTGAIAVAVAAAAVWRRTPTSPRAIGAPPRGGEATSSRRTAVGSTLSGSATDEGDASL